MSKLKCKLSVVLPVYNEEKMILQVVESAYLNVKKIADNFELLIINDASNDNTLNILKKIKIKELKIINHSVNLGIEKTVKELYEKAKFDLIFFNGADGDIDMKVMLNLYEKMIESGADIVVGNRIVKNYSIKRKIISTSYNKLVYIMTGVKVYDAGTVKLVKKNIFKNITTESTSVFGEAERLIKAVTRGAKLSKVDIVQNINESNDKINYYQLILCIKDLLTISAKARTGRL